MLLPTERAEYLKDPNNTVECPCCKGLGKLHIHPADGDPAYFTPCCHCGSNGRVSLSNVSDNVFE